MGTINKSAMNGGGKDFDPHPEGIFQAVLCDVVDLGYIEKSFEGKSQGFKPHVQFVFQTDEIREDGKPFLIFGRRSVLSFDERANFRKELDAMLGKKAVEELLTQDEWDTDDLIGTNVRVSVVHNQGNDGKTYANIGNMFPWNPKKDGPTLQVSEYERRHDRDSWIDPVPSAFDEPEKAKRILAKKAGQQEMEEIADAAEQQAPRQSKASTASGNALSVGRIKDAQLEKLYELAPNAGGIAAVKEIAAKKFQVAELSELSSDEAANLIHELRAIKPTTAVANKSKAIAEESDDEPDVFADEGEPGFVPEEEREAVLAAGKAQPELISAGAEVNTAHR